jgi:YHS domain-containing protein/thioredoxin-related protein
MSRLPCGICTFALVCAVAQAACANSPWLTDFDQARREAQRLNRPILCHFGAKWCAPCQKMERSVLNQPAVLQQLQATVVPVKIDVNEHPEIAQRFGVESFPTDVFLEPSGARMVESTGFQTQDEYIAMLSRASRRYSDSIARQQPKQSPPVNVAPDTGSAPTQLAKQAPAQLMLEGYCPVTLQKDRQWTKGDPQLVTEYKGQAYQFASAQAREEFLRNPDGFVPQFLGCDPVLLWTSDRAAPGRIDWGAYYDNRLYLFTSQDNRRKFKESPDKYMTTKVVLNIDQIESVIR